MPKRTNNNIASEEDFYPGSADDNPSEPVRKKLSVDQKKAILSIVETSMRTSSSSNSAFPHTVEMANQYQHDSLQEKLSLDQRREILSLIEQGIEVTGHATTESSMQRPQHEGITITRSQKNEIMLLVEQSLEAMVDETSKHKRRHYTKEQKDEMLALTTSCAEEGMSTNAAIKYLNTIPGYEKVTRKMIREWRLNRFPAPRGRKVSHEFEVEVIAEILDITGHDVTNPACNVKDISFEEVRRAAINVRDRHYAEVGQKWMTNPKTKDLHFSSNWVRKLLARASRANAVQDKDADPNNNQSLQLELETDSDEEAD
jgi:hypothetical protein